MKDKFYKTKRYNKSGHCLAGVSAYTTLAAAKRAARADSYITEQNRRVEVYKVDRGSEILMCSYANGREFFTNQETK